MTLRKVPCFNNGKKCEKRFAGCHSQCEDYKAWRREKDEDNVRKREYVENLKKFDDIEFKRRKRKGGR